MAAIGKKRKCSRMVSWQEKATERQQSLIKGSISADMALTVMT